MFEAPTEEYKKYRYLFDNEDFSCTWVESAFEPKSAGLLADEEKNPTVAILHYPYKTCVAGHSNVSERVEWINLK